MPASVSISEHTVPWNTEAMWPAYGSSPKTATPFGVPT
jgi:hypothetical protein